MSRRSGQMEVFGDLHALVRSRHRTADERSPRTGSPKNTHHSRPIQPKGRVTRERFAEITR